MSRFDKLSDVEFKDNKELEMFCSELQSICRELFSEVYFASEILYQNLASMPDEKSRVKARRVSNALKKASEMFHAAGGLSVKTWRTFQTSYSAELDAARGVRKKKDPFTFKA